MITIGLGFRLGSMFTDALLWVQAVGLPENEEKVSVRNIRMKTNAKLLHRGSVGFLVINRTISSEVEKHQFEKKPIQEADIALLEISRQSNNRCLIECRSPPSAMDRNLVVY